MNAKSLRLLLAFCVITPYLATAAEPTGYPTVDQPAPFTESFYPDVRPVEDQTQAAYLLVLLNLADPVRGVDPEEMAPPEDLEVIGLSPALFKAAGQTWRPRPFREIADRYGLQVGRYAPFTQDLVEEQRQLARRIGAEPQPADIAELSVISFHHPDPLVRVAAAPLVLVTTDAGDAALDTLREATGHDDDRIRDLALTLLARYNPGDPVLSPHVGRRAYDRGQQEEPRTTLVIHGTWASDADWWRNDGDFFEYLEHGVPVDDLFLGDDPYAWSGDWDHDERLQAAVDLEDWLAAHGETCVDVIAHSHGANVAFIAAPQLDYGRLVVLSTPSHKTLYPTDPDSPILSVRVHLDLVVLADGGGNKFPSAANIQETYIGWFNHSATHDPDRWVDQGVASLLPVGNCSP